MACRECLEQARLLGMGAERELALQARLSRAIGLLKEARPAVLEMAVGYGEPDEARLVEGIDSFLQGEGK